jgi:hypothetical protein
MDFDPRRVKCQEQGVGPIFLLRSGPLVQTPAQTGTGPDQRTNITYVLYQNRTNIAYASVHVACTRK